LNVKALIIVKRHPANLVEPCIIVSTCNSFFLLLKSERKENSRVANEYGNLASKKGEKKRRQKRQKNTSVRLNPKPYLTSHSSASHDFE
jgi:hypothetical protein